MKKLFYAFFAALFSFSLMADVTVADKGESNHVIVIPDRCSGYIQNSVADMQNILQQITGVKLPVMKESDVKSGTPKISVGNTAFAKKHTRFAKDANAEEMMSASSSTRVKVKPVTQNHPLVPPPEVDAYPTRNVPSVPTTIASVVCCSHPSGLSHIAICLVGETATSPCAFR